MVVSLWGPRHRCWARERWLARKPHALQKQVLRSLLGTSVVQVRWLTVSDGGPWHMAVNRSLSSGSGEGAGGSFKSGRDVIDESEKSGDSDEDSSEESGCGGGQVGATANSRDPSISTSERSTSFRGKRPGERMMGRVEGRAPIRGVGSSRCWQVSKSTSGGSMQA